MEREQDRILTELLSSMNDGKLWAAALEINPTISIFHTSKGWYYTHGIPGGRCESAAHPNYKQTLIAFMISDLSSPKKDKS